MGFASPETTAGCARSSRRRAGLHDRLALTSQERIFEPIPILNRLPTAPNGVMEAFDASCPRQDDLEVPADGNGQGGRDGKPRIGGGRYDYAALQSTTLATRWGDAVGPCGRAARPGRRCGWCRARSAPAGPPPASAFSMRREPPQSSMYAGG